MMKLRLFLAIIKTNFHIVLLCSLVAIFCSSCLDSTPTYRRSDIEKIIKNICQKEFKIDVKVTETGDSIWIYTPFEKALVDEEGEFDKDVAKSIRKVSLAITRSILSMDQPPHFYVFVSSDIKERGTDLYSIGFYYDTIKFQTNFLSLNDLHERTLFFGVLNSQALGDKKGKHIKPYDISMEEFIMLLALQNLQREYAIGEIAKHFMIFDLDAKYSDNNVDIIIDIMIKKYIAEKGLPIDKAEKIAKRLIDIYSSFTDLATIKIVDKFNEETRTLTFPKRKKLTLSTAKVNDRLLKLYKANFYLNYADHLYKENEMGKALAYFQTAIRIDSTLRDSGNFGIGNVYFSHEEYELAIQYYTKSLEIRPTSLKNEGIYLNRGNCYYTLALYHQYNFRPYSRFLENIKPAIDDFKKCIKLNPKNYAAHLQLGFAYLTLNDARAEKHFNIVLAESEDIMEIGWAHYGLQHYWVSLSTFKKAAEKPKLKDSPDPYLAMGQVYRTLWELSLLTGGNSDMTLWQESVDSYKEAFNRNSKAVSALLALGNLHAAVDRNDKAINYYNEIIEFCDEKGKKVVTLFKAYIELTRVHITKNEKIKGIDFLNEATKLDSESPLVNLLYGNIYLDLGKLENALLNFKKAVKLNPDLANVYYNMGLTYYRMQEYEQARKSFTEAKEKYIAQKTPKMAEKAEEALRLIP